MIRGLILRALVRAVDSAPLRQLLSLVIHADEDEPGSVDHWEPYGLTARPHAGAEALTLAVGGAADGIAVICVGDRRYRIRGLATGEVALYDDLGQSVILTRTGIDVRSPRVRMGSDPAALVLPFDGLVHGRGIDPFTGASYAAIGNASARVLGER